MLLRRGASVIFGSLGPSSSRLTMPGKATSTLVRSRAPSTYAQNRQGSLSVASNETQARGVLRAGRQLDHPASSAVFPKPAGAR
jgi:hypothetical protein